MFQAVEGPSTEPKSANLPAAQNPDLIIQAEGALLQPYPGDEDLDDGMRDFLGNLIEVCMVTKDPERTMAGLWRLGIGPWRAYTFTPENTTNQT
ncbi:hypothetical protein WJX84_004354 [Apatococcus fuscideae]|uniref:Uncharacterized protein n=1 Tax=Apatococcus fuscideae TaxID=2026836 RepID=A0AAW1RXR5_9CHLO